MYTSNKQYRWIFKGAIILKDYINKEYVTNMVRQFRRSNIRNGFYITKKQERDIILISLKPPKDFRSLDITNAVKEYLEDDCTQVELIEYVLNRYFAWEYKNIPEHIEKKPKAKLKIELIEQYSDYEKRLKEIGITWVGFKARIEKGMSFEEALTMPKIKPKGRRKRLND